MLEDFVSDDEVAAMRKECYNMIEEMDPAEHQTKFSTTTQNYRNDYFINSADKIGYFFEEDALNDKGELLVDKQRSLNKVGHALHVLCPSFKKVTFGSHVKELMRRLDYKDPVVFQSMCIFKQPGIGGAVVPHQDATFLWTEPLRLMGLWIALEDTTVNNGCLSFIPGSHKDGLHGNRRMVRSSSSEGPTTMFRGEETKYDNEKFVSVPVKKGSAILIDGLVVHKSEHNFSEKSRHIYTFHVYDKGVATYSEENWLQPTDVNTFCSIYEG